MNFTKTSQKFGQWADSRANTVFGLGFPSEQQLSKFAEKFQEVKEAAKVARERSQEKAESGSTHSHIPSQKDVPVYTSPVAPIFQHMTVMLSESGHEAPISPQASSVNGTEEEKGSRSPPIESLLKSNNHRINPVKKWEQELRTLGESNARLSAALQESASTAEHWRNRLQGCKEEGERLREKIMELEAESIDINKEREQNSRLSQTVRLLEAEIAEKEQELEKLREDVQVIPGLLQQCNCLQQQLQGAENSNVELESRSKTLKCNVEESRQKYENLLKDLTTFLGILDGKLDELHGFRQGLAKLGMDN
ncbi:homer protein homolog 2 isoform X3 [Hypanus sabinus]|nr:homer protein homolog 2 isoform X3 [Hypanus sabinus]XP_059809131.1 homer protein homolog 2 isoform X3 [Hypanus sabinus]